MKKLLLFILAILPMVVLTACSSDDDKNETSLVGTWERAGEGFTEKIIFSKNQILEVIKKDNGEERENKGAYVTDGKKITVNWIVSRSYSPITQTWSNYKENKEEHIYTYTVQGKKLTVKEIKEGKEGEPSYLLKKE